MFSTGPFIDSFSVVGKILNSETFEPEKDFLVMIYDSIKFYKDSFSFKFLPDYFTKTDASGAFNISNVKKGSFKLFALKDANSNYKYDSPDEKIAFYDSIFTTDTLPKLFELNSFLATPSAQFIKKSNFTEFQKMDFVFNKPAEKIDFNFFNFSVSKESYSLEFGKKRDSLTLYFNKKIELDSLNFSINENGKVLDTFYTKTISYDKANKKIAVFCDALYILNEKDLIKILERDDPKLFEHLVNKNSNVFNFDREHALKRQCHDIFGLFLFQ